MNYTNMIPILVKVLSEAAAFESGQPVTIAIPTETATLDLTAEGLGKVQVAESGTTLTLKKV